jgi:predicted nucleotidyltransferase
MRQPISIDATAERAVRPTLAAFAGQLLTEGAASVWLYGSVARGTEHAKSDVDLFVEASESVGKELDRAYYWAVQPRVTLDDGSVRAVHLVTSVTTGTNDPIFFCQMQPEARRMSPAREPR